MPKTRGAGDGAKGGRTDTMRLDVLLFELRLFKSRSQAGEAIRQERVLLNGAPAKPSREARAGDVVTLARGDPREVAEGGPRVRTLEVIELPRGSLSKEAARALVRELPRA
jgi:ribosomal 50S subunit-recycling heat shock protein